MAALAILSTVACAGTRTTSLEAAKAPDSSSQKNVVAVETRRTSTSTTLTAPTAIGGGPQAVDAAPLGSEAFDSHVLAHRKALREACFEYAESRGIYSVRLDVTVRPDGSVAHVSPATASADPITKCIEREVSSWQFPPSGGGTYSMKLYFGD